MRHKINKLPLEQRCKWNNYIYSPALILIPNFLLHSCCHQLHPFWPALLPDPLLSSHVLAWWSPSFFRANCKSQITARVQDLSGHTHQPHWAHFQALPLTPHKPGEVHMIQHHLLLLATHFKAQHNGNHPVLMTICRHITGTLNAHWKLLQLSAGLCAQPSIMERLGWMDQAAPDTECCVPYDSNGDSSLISLFSHSLSISHHVNTLSTLPICPFISTGCGTVINHLQSKTKK